MNLLPVFLASTFLFLLIVPGCSKTPTESRHPQYEEGLTTQAWMMLDTGAPFDEYFPVQQEAVKQLRAGVSRENPVAVLEQMAYFLFSAGRLEEALPYFNEALDSLHSQPMPPASECAIQLYGDLSQFYDCLGMSDKAIQYSDSALAVSRRIGGVLMSDIWRFRAQIHANDNQTTEAFTCLDSAANAIRHIMEDPDSAMLLAIIDAERANLILSRNPSPDSVDLAVRLLRNITEFDSIHDFSNYDGPLGQALYLQGHKKDGIRLMEKTLERVRTFGDLELTFLELRRLIEVYSAEKMFDKVSAYYPEYTLLGDSMSRARHNLDLVSAKVRADVAVKELENRLLREKLVSSTRKNIAITAGFILFTIIALYFFLRGHRYYVRMKHRRYAERARRISAEAGFNEAINERNSALERIETIKSEISDRVASSTDILHRPQALDNNFGLFRRAFMAMYPNFTNDLRRDFPSLTDTDIVFCMLIFLKHSTEEISIYLNISRASVNSARYRIRTKLKLAKEDNLDKFLQSRQG